MVSKIYNLVIAFIHTKQGCIYSNIYIHRYVCIIDKGYIMMCFYSLSFWDSGLYQSKTQTQGENAEDPLERELREREN